MRRRQWVLGVTFGIWGSGAAADEAPDTTRPPLTDTTTTEQANRLLSSSAPAQPAVLTAVEDVAKQPATAPSTGSTEQLPASPEPSREASQVVTVKAAPRVPGERAIGSTASKFEVSRDRLGASLSSISADTMRERGLFDINSSLQLVPGVTPIWEYGGFQFMTIRGFEEFTVLDDFRRDDRNTFVASAPLSGLWDVERIEVLRGPASASYGYSSIGGVVNIVRKRPSATNSNSFFAQFGGPEQNRLQSGVNRSYFDRQLLMRIDAGSEYRSDYRGSTTRRTGGSLALSLFPGERNSFGLRLAASSDGYNTDTGLPTVNGRVPENMSLGRRFNTPQDGMRYTRIALDLDYEGRLKSWLKAVDRFRVALDDYTYLSTEGLSVSTDGAQVNREYFFLERHWKPLFNQAELIATHALGGGVTNNALVGIETSLMDSNHPRSKVWAIPVQPVPVAGGNIADPQPAIDIRRDAEDRMSQVAHGVYLQDRLTFPSGFEIDLSGRFDAWERTRRRDTWDPSTESVLETGPSKKYETTAITAKGALIYKPNATSSTYLTVANAFRPNEIITADNRQFDPQRGVQAELGQSITLGDLGSMHASAFAIQKSNIVIPLGQEKYDQAAGLLSTGADVQLDLSMGRWMSGTVGYAYTDARFTQYTTETGVNLSGKRPRISAPHSGSFWLSSNPFGGLKVSLGGRGQGDAYADNGNTVLMPGYLTFDAAASWRRGDLSLGATVRNIADQRRYFTSSINGSQLTPGPGREALVNLQVDL